MKIKAIAFTQRAYELGERMLKLLGDNHDIEIFHTRETKGALAWTKEHFHQTDALIYLGAAAIAVRSIAPLLSSKTTDPGVLVVDEGGRFAIPLLSGHLGGANDLANEVASLIGGIAVITTATDQRGLFAVDSWGKSQNLYIVNPNKIVEISSALLNGENVGFSTTLAYKGTLPEYIFEEEISPRFIVSPYIQKTDEDLQLVPRQLTLGIGCRKDTTLETIESLFLDITKTYGIHPKAFDIISSIDLKKQEIGIIAFAKKYQLDFSTYSAKELGRIKGEFTSSSFVKEITGVDNVCERSAVAQGETLIIGRQKKSGVTMAVGEKTKILTFA